MRNLPAGRQVRNKEVEGCTVRFHRRGQELIEFTQRSSAVSLLLPLSAVKIFIS